MAEERASAPPDSTDVDVVATHTPAVADQPVASSSTPEIQVFNPAPTPSSSSTPVAETPLDEGFFEPSLSDVQSHHASVVARSRRLNEAPLLTAKHRDAERAEREKKKAAKWPTTTIRIRFSDGTQIQNVFPSTSPIQPVYAFVRSSLDPSVAEKPFMLWQPPRNQYPEHPAPTAKKANPHKTNIVTAANYGPVRGGQTQGLQSGTGGKETLNELGLVPQSVLVIRWDGEENETMNASSFGAPLRADLLEKSQPLPPAVPKEASKPGEQKGNGGASAGGQKPEKKIPKWLQKGLMKRK